MRINKGELKRLKELEEKVRPEVEVYTYGQDRDGTIRDERGNIVTEADFPKGDNVKNIIYSTKWGNEPVEPGADIVASWQDNRAEHDSKSS